MDDVDLKAALAKVDDLVTAAGELATQLNAAIEDAKAAIDEFRTKIDA